MTDVYGFPQFACVESGRPHLPNMEIVLAYAAFHAEGLRLLSAREARFVADNWLEDAEASETLCSCKDAGHGSQESI
jgi:hypothetical protein